jgi:ribosomal protein S27AE
VKEIQKFDMLRKPLRQRFFWTLLAWLLSYPETKKRNLKIKKIGMEGLKPPFLFLSNHMAFVDFKVATRALFPFGANYVVAIDGFLINEWLLRQVGCICKRKFTDDILLLRHMRYSLETNKAALALYPEARYSYCGTNSVLPESLGKLIKMLKVPVVSFIQHGNYLSQPQWNLDKRDCPLEVTMTRLLTPGQIEKTSVTEINRLVNEAFEYDEYRWQKENNIRIDFPDRAKGLHKILYQCPRCRAESMMDSDKDELWCGSCHKHWKMSELGELSAVVGETEFSHIPDWFEWQRAQVRKEIEEGKYFFQDQVIVDSLPNAKGYIRLGEATLTHSIEGFLLERETEGESYRLEKKPLSLYSLHIEYDYKGKGDCIDLSTLEDTFYIYPITRKNVVTKLQFAVEEIYKIRQAELLAQKTAALFALDAVEMKR